MFYNGTIPFTVDDQIYNVYLLEDELKTIPHLGTAWHMHTCAEIHIVFSGGIQFDFGKFQQTLSVGQALLIPAQQYHSSTALSPNTMEYTFILDAPATHCQRTQYTKELLTEVSRSFDACQSLRSPQPLTPWLYRFLLDLAFEKDPTMYEKASHDHMLKEYLFRNYQSSPSLEDLEQYSGISRRQIQRIFQAKTGHSFVDELLTVRMNTAEYLLQHSNMTQEEIAAHVGYQTFAGFWKARKKFKNMQKKNSEG